VDLDLRTCLQSGAGTQLSSAQWSCPSLDHDLHVDVSDFQKMIVELRLNGTCPQCYCFSELSATLCDITLAADSLGDDWKCCYLERLRAARPALCDWLICDAFVTCLCVMWGLGHRVGVILCSIYGSCHLIVVCVATLLYLPVCCTVSDGKSWVVLAAVKHTRS